MTMVCVEQSQEHTFNVEWKGQFISTVDGHGMAGSRCIMHWGVGCKLTQRFPCPRSAVSLLSFNGSISHC